MENFTVYNYAPTNYVDYWLTSQEMPSPEIMELISLYNNGKITSK